MPERQFQMALLHLYRAVDQTPAYSDAAFEQFALSAQERQWLRELMESQRDALLLFNEQLHGKRRRFLREALVVSRAACRRRFETLVDDYVLAAGLEGPADGPALVRGFADFAAGRPAEAEDNDRARELVRFEALLAAVSASPAATARPARLSADLRLGLGADAELVCCHHDVTAAMSDPAALATAPRLSPPQWFLLFGGGTGGARSLAITPALAAVLGLFRHGATLRQVLQRLEGAPTRTLARRSLAQLLAAGVPFFLAGPSARPRSGGADE